MKELSFHALANEYPLMPAYELGRMEQGMTEDGFDARFPIVIYQKQILDGRNRYTAAKAAGVKPVYVTFKGSEEAARKFVQKANEERRHLAADWLKRRREERIERVAAKREEGKSERTIAAEENVSRAQVKRDLEEARLDRGGPVEPPNGKVTGKDGRTVTATREKKPPVLCERCQRVGPTEGCDACKSARKAKAPVVEKKAPVAAPDAQWLDAFKEPVPPQLRPAFSLAPRFREAEKLLTEALSVVEALAESPAGKRLPKQQIEIDIKNAKNALKQARPHTVCPYCQAKKESCEACRGCGWVTKLTYDQAPKEMTA